MVPYEPASGVRAVNVRDGVRRSGTAGVLGGLLVAAGTTGLALTGADSSVPPLDGVRSTAAVVAAVGYALVASSLFGVHRRYGTTYGRVGLVGAWLVGVGAALLTAGVAFLATPSGIGPLFAFLWLFYATVGATLLGVGLGRAEAPRSAAWAAALVVPLVALSLGALAVVPVESIVYRFVWSLAFGGGFGILWTVVCLSPVRDPVAPTPSSAEHASARRTPRLTPSVRRSLALAGTVGGPLAAAGAVGLFSVGGAYDFGRSALPTVSYLVGMALVVLSAPAVYALGRRLGLEGTVGATLATAGVAGVFLATGLFVAGATGTLIVLAGVVGVTVGPFPLLGLTVLGVALLRAGDRVAGGFCALAVVGLAVVAAVSVGAFELQPSLVGAALAVPAGLAWTAVCLRARRSAGSPSVDREMN